MDSVLGQCLILYLYIKKLIRTLRRVPVALQDRVEKKIKLLKDDIEKVCCLTNAITIIGGSTCGCLKKHRTPMFLY